MTKGYDKHQEHLGLISLLGKDLARRSHSSCELCGASGVRLNAYEVPPTPTEPELEKTLFVCETCQSQINKPATMDPHHWRCLNTTVWSELPVAQVMAVRLLKRLASDNAWASELLEQVYLEPDIEQWVSKAE